MTKNKKLAKKELEKIYDSQYQWLNAGRQVGSKLSKSLDECPKLGLLLKLAIIANIGIWSSFALLVMERI